VSRSQTWILPRPRLSRICRSCIRQASSSSFPTLLLCCPFCCDPAVLLPKNSILCSKLSRSLFSCTCIGTTISSPCSIACNSASSSLPAITDSFRRPKRRTRSRTCSVACDLAVSSSDSNDEEEEEEEVSRVNKLAATPRKFPTSRPMGAPDVE